MEITITDARPVGTTFTYTRSAKVKHEATVIGTRVEWNSDTGEAKVSYRISYDFCGQLMKTDVPATTVERALWDGVYGSQVYPKVTVG